MNWANSHGTGRKMRSMNDGTLEVTARGKRYHDTTDEAPQEGS
tara:strand:- start:365 stop:493 length:129 start_codon:yes stop_codon:yes gene_type:complete